MGHEVKITKNETHWQSRDISRMVRLSFQAAREEAKQRVHVEVYQAPNASVAWDLRNEWSRYVLRLYLPKRGCQSDQPPLVQLAQATLGANGNILPPHQTYILAKAITWRLLRRHTVKQRGVRQRTARVKAIGYRPYWIPENFAIRKYAPKKKPEDNRTFIEKVEDDIARAEERVEKWEAEIERAEAHLKRAQRDLKKHKRRLKEAKKRRGK
jgi:hypothetical protein